MSSIITLLDKKLSKPALEVIDFQKDDFGAKLEVIITAISTKILNDEYTDPHELRFSDEVKQIQELVFKRLGLKIKITCHQILAAIVPFYSNKNHIFINDFWRGGFTIKDQEKILKEAHGREGSVDLERAKLGGIFSEYENVVHMHFHALIKDLQMSPAEITGVFLHELGHGFAVCEYSDRLETINQVLANVALEVLSKKKEKNLSYVYRELQKVNPEIKEAEVDILLNGDRVIAGAKWFNVIIGTVKYQLNNNVYDESAFEQLADNFASRFGYGRPAIIALDKIHSYFGDASKSKSTIRVIQSISLVALIGWLAVIASLLVTAIPMGVLYSVLLLFVLRISGEDTKSHTYDELKRRYLRIRNDTVELLKTDLLNAETAKHTLEDIYTMDKVIKETHQWEGIFTTISNIAFKSNRMAKQSIEEQQMLEDLIANDLFVQAARLKFA